MATIKDANKHFGLFVFRVNFALPFAKNFYFLILLGLVEE